MSAAGETLKPLDEDEVRGRARRLREFEVESFDVCLLLAHRSPGHERPIGDILREEPPGLPVSLSSEILREQQYGVVPRTAGSVDVDGTTALRAFRRSA